ncbi:hypothetical protein SteCoe_28134 [Stentor coeruleus]|uniref:Uncharacterized protein n=1 Tax=Stentor coeruleus TaxID=5963 RepID=A0A1R2B8W8_9CILI|nr:hypothetical protein SteCoe_28134 [Stentor coeruleus]
MKSSIQNHIFRPSSSIYGEKHKKVIKYLNSSSSKILNKGVNSNTSKYLIKFPDMSKYLKKPGRSSVSTGESNQNSHIFSHENIKNNDSKPWILDSSESEIHGNGLESDTKFFKNCNWEVCTNTWSFNSIDRNKKLEKTHVLDDKSRFLRKYKVLKRSNSVCFSVKNEVSSKNEEITNQNHTGNDNNQMEYKCIKRILLKKDKIISENTEIYIRYYYDISEYKLCIVPDKNPDLGEAIMRIPEEDCLFDVICNKIHPFVKIANGKLVLDSPFFSDKIIGGEGLKIVHSIDLTKIFIKLQSMFRGYKDRKKIHRGQDLTLFKQIDDINYKINFDFNSKDKILNIFISHNETKYHLKLTDPIPISHPYHRSIKSSLMLHNGTLALNTESSSFVYFTILSDSNKKTSEIPMKNTLKKLTKKTISKVSLIQNQIPVIPQLNIFPKLVYNRILYRKAIKKHNTIYQICMHVIQSKNQDDVLVFTIKSTYDDSNSHKFMIDLLTLTQLTGLDANHLLTIANYVSNYMIIIKDIDIIYLDTSAKDLGLNRCVTKIQSIWRGILLRKAQGFNTKSLVYKKKVWLCKELWTCLAYSSKENLILKFVRGIDVVEFWIKKMFIDEKYQIKSIDEFLIHEVYPFLKPELRGKGRVLVGMPEIYMDCCGR